MPVNEPGPTVTAIAPIEVDPALAVAQHVLDDRAERLRMAVRHRLAQPRQRLARRGVEDGGRGRAAGCVDRQDPHANHYPSKFAA